jgi:hypothetical protein
MQWEASLKNLCLCLCLCLLSASGGLSCVREGAGVRAGQQDAGDTRLRDGIAVYTLTGQSIRARTQHTQHTANESSTHAASSAHASSTHASGTHARFQHACVYQDARARAGCRTAHAGRRTRVPLGWPPPHRMCAARSRPRLRARSVAARGVAVARARGAAATGVHIPFSEAQRQWAGIHYS